MNRVTEQEQNFVGFGAAEVAYVLSRLETPAGRRSAEELKIDLSSLSDEVLGLGASSLFARGLLVTRDGQTVAPDGLGALLAAGLDYAERWIEVGLINNDGEPVEACIFASGPDRTLVLQPRLFGSWVVLLRDPSLTDDQAIKQVFDGFLAQFDQGSAVITASTLTKRAGFGVSKRGGELQLARKQSPLWEASEPHATDDAEINETLRTLLTLSE